MAPISVQQLSFSLVPPRHGLTATLWEILTLRQKLTAPESQSWYFRKGLESHQRRLHELTQNYEQKRQEFNDVSVNEYLELKAIIDYELKNVISEMRPRVVQAICETRAQQKLQQIHEALSLKSRIDTLHTAEYYEAQPDAFLEVLGDWEEVDGGV